jgi:hypothetical protein
VNSDEWYAALQTMDDLVWSVAPHEDPEERLRLLELVPGLLRALREGMASAAFDPFSTSEFFSQLEVLHVQAFQRFKRATPEAETAIPEDAAPIELSEDGIELPLLELPTAEEIEDAPAMVEVVEEIILLAPGQTRPQEPDVALPDDDEALMQVDSLRVGSWVEIQEDEEHKLRCKLAAIIKPTGKYVFVNRTGMKVLEKSRNALAVEFRRNAVRLLDDALLFDRALESVIGNLRKLKNA